MLETISKIASSAALGEGEIERVVRYVRTHLGMDVAWVTRCTSAGQVIELLDGADDRFGLRVGELLPAALPGTCRANAHAMVPLRYSDGRLYGLLGCLSEHPRPALRARDDEFLELAAALLAPSLDARQLRREQRARIGARTQAILAGGGPDVVYQPIASLDDQRTVAFEALARFPAHAGPATPDQWFIEADRVDLRTDLEVKAIRAALTALDWLEPRIRIAVNVCATTLHQPALAAELGRHDLSRVIVEVTEHEQVSDYPRLRGLCSQLRGQGAAIAIDDTGSGYAGLHHLVETRPDIIKLDRALIHGIDTDRGRAAMARGLLTFADAINATVLAEGIETAAELTALTRLGVPLGQGHHLGRPNPLPHTISLPDAALVASSGGA
jgi:EAL domain-containing protein (putative c-di-GMP-specific phosphodiesterase class I)